MQRKAHWLDPIVKPMLHAHFLWLFLFFSELYVDFVCFSIEAAFYFPCWSAVKCPFRATQQRKKCNNAINQKLWHGTRGTGHVVVILKTFRQSVKRPLQFWRLPQNWRGLLVESSTEFNRPLGSAIELSRWLQFWRGLLAERWSVFKMPRTGPVALIQLADLYEWEPRITAHYFIIITSI